MKRENTDVTYGLPLESIVGGRYLIQKVCRVQEDQIVYLAADLVEKKQVELIEYFPQELVTRNGAGGEENVTVLPGGQAKVAAADPASSKQSMTIRYGIIIRCMRFRK